MTESTEVSLSTIYSFMRSVTTQLTKIAAEYYDDDDSMLPTVSKCLQQWSKAIVTPVVHVAYVLDPTQYLDDKNWLLGARAMRSSTTHERKQHKEFEAELLDAWCQGDLNLRRKIEEQLDEFKEGKGLLFPLEDSTLGTRVKERLSSIQMPGDLASPGLRRQRIIDFWRKFGDYVPELQELALVLAFMPVSNADGERNFSSYGMIINGRESMGLEKRTKVLYLMHNLKLNDLAMRKDGEAKRRWKQTTAKNYFLRVREILQGSVKHPPEKLVLQVEVPDEILEAAGTPVSQPDFAQELKFRVQAVDARVARGARLSMKDKASYTKMKNALVICMPDEMLADEEDEEKSAFDQKASSPMTPKTPKTSLDHELRPRYERLPDTRQWKSNDIEISDDDEDDLRVRIKPASASGSFYGSATTDPEPPTEGISPTCL
jgi:hypothetical protein